MSAPEPPAAARQAMGGIPAGAIRAALAAREHALIDRPTPTVLSDEMLMRITLEAAAPHLAREAAAAERERIAAWAEEHGAAIAVEGDWSTLLPVAALLRGGRR